MRTARRGALRGPLLLLLFVALFVSRCGQGSGPGEQFGEADRAQTLTARVTHVVDGDTIEVELPDGSEEDVRYIGIDTPETVKPGTPVQCGGPRAHEVNERLVDGRTVRLRFDEERRDVYGRLLAYVYVPRPSAGPLFVNAELAQRGLARTLTIPPNDRFADLFARLAARAGVAGRGLWGSCPL
jgi:micrococcal nuclease